MSVVKVFLVNGAVMVFPGPKNSVVGPDKHGALVVGYSHTPKSGAPPYTSPIAMFANGIWAYFLVVDLEG